MIARIAAIVSVGPATHVLAARWHCESVRPGLPFPGSLGIGSKTVETHLRRLFERFGLASRTELATRASREGWLDVPMG
jgi:hypothetical protein